MTIVNKTMSINKRAKLDMAIEKALFKYFHKVKENVYDFTFLYVKKDPVLSQTISTETLKELLKIVQLGISQSKSNLIGEFNNDIKSALDEYVGEENPTLSMSKLAVEEQKEEAAATSQVTQSPKPKAKISISLPSPE